MDQGKERNISYWKEVQSHAKAEGPFKALERITNVHKTGLQGINTIFNVSNLISFVADELDLESNTFKGGGDDASLDCA